jgi:broad specificity phosphatase PhoE
VTERPTRTASLFDQAFLTDAPDVTELLLIRHAQQVVNPEGTAAEITDPPLSEQGRQQAQLVGERLSTTNLDAILSSPMARARETAEAIARHHRLEVEVIDDLQEIGIFRDLPRDRSIGEVLNRDLLMAVRQRMLQERSWDVYPASESSAAFRKRVVNAIETIIARKLGERVAVICHGGVINMYLGHIVGSPYDMFFRPAHTSLNVAAAGGSRRVLRLLNDIHHLATAEGDFGTY